MNKMKNNSAYICLMALATVVFALYSCNKALKPASVVVLDPVRHYYPVLQGEMMDIAYEIENTSDYPLFIEEIQTTCGCIVPRSELPIVVLPHKISAVYLSFNTIKNTGYVDHFIYCYGNFQDSTYIELEFDTNVVPRADYIRDYEQLWQEQTRRVGSLREFVDGMPSQKGYYTDSGTDPRTEFKESFQGDLDGMSF